MSTEYLQEIYKADYDEHTAWNDQFLPPHLKELLSDGKEEIYVGSLKMIKRDQLNLL